MSRGLGGRERFFFIGTFFGRDDVTGDGFFFVLYSLGGLLSLVQRVTEWKDASRVCYGGPFVF